MKYKASSLFRTISTVMLSGFLFWACKKDKSGTDPKKPDEEVVTPGNPPSSDEYDRAAALAVNPDYNCTKIVSGTTSGATQSAQASCNAKEIDDDVWYKFTATKASHIVQLSNITNTAGTSTPYRHIEVFKNLNSTSGERIACSGYSDTETLLTGLTIGSIYHIRIYADNLGLTGSDSRRINFDICILSPPTPPSNDEYDRAVALTVSPNYNCTTPVIGTTDGATQSPQASCNPKENEDDVWYKFIATKPSHIVQLSNITNAYGTSTAYRHIEVFKSVNGTSGERIVCTTYDDAETLLTGLAVGSTYHIRIYADDLGAGGGIRKRVNFNICILTPQSPPSNDEYDRAVALTVNPDYNRTNSVSGTTDGATQSPQVSCNPKENDDDVWYKFIATKASHIVQLSNITNAHGTSGTYRHIEVFKSINGATVERTACSSVEDNEALLTELAIGNTYYVRVYANDLGAGGGIRKRINFDISILTPSNPPSNDEYDHAVALTVNPDQNCATTVSGTTDGATLSPQASCKAKENDDDVWYKFTAAKASHVVRLSNITNAYGTSGTYRHIEVFKTINGTSGERIACTAVEDKETVLAGLTIGTTYYIRIYADDLGAGGGIHKRINFDICVLTP